MFVLPTETGPRAGTLTIRTLRDADPYLVALDGIGDENRVPVLELSATRVGFGNALLGSATRVRAPCAERPGCTRFRSIMGPMRRFGLRFRRC